MAGLIPIPAQTAEEIFAQIEPTGRITARDVLTLRRAIYGRGNIGHRHANWIFRIDHSCRTKHGKWREFYVDALTDYFIWQTWPREYITEDQGEFLIRNLLRDNRIAGITELELLVNLSHWAISTPDLFKVLTLEAVRDSVLELDESLYGHGRKPGVVTPVDVAIMRRAFYGSGGFGGYTISKQEAEVIFEIADATADAKNAGEWDNLFVKMIANFLMFPRGEPKVLTAEQYSSREVWLNARRGTATLLKEIGKSSLSYERLKSGWEFGDVFGTQERREKAEMDSAEFREALSRESINATEARWLVDKINADGKVTANERTLLRFIRQYSPSIDPYLDAFMKRLDI